MLILFLVILLWSGQHVPNYQVDAQAIADLEVSPSQHYASSPVAGTHDVDNENIYNENHLRTEPFSQGELHLREASPVNTTLPTSSKASTHPFVDPAILSFTKPSTTLSDTIDHAPTAPLPETLPGTVSAATPTRKPQTFQLAATTSTQPLDIQPKRERKDSTATATLTEPFTHLELNGDSGLENRKQPTAEERLHQEDVPVGRKGAAPLEAPVKYTGKRSRRGGRGKVQKDMASQTIPPIATMDDPDSFPMALRKANVKAKGWRQTAFVEEPAPVKQPAQKLSNETGNRSKTKKLRTYQEDQNGWATGDATDIQEMGDFDFESNLSKFDKRRVFDQIRNDDTTADEDRLVSFNRKAPKPGTSGGKNLHYTENVLDPPQVKTKRTSEAGQTDEDELSDAHFSSGRNSRRALSHAPVRQMSSRKGSTILGQSLAPASLARGQYSSSRTESPRPSKQTLSASPISGSIASSRASLRLASTNRPCPCVSPLQMLEIESLAIAELGITEDMLTENAGRGIAEAALSQATDLSASPIVLILVGNHKSGSRAVAAGRHLRNRGLRVTLCVLGLEREPELLESLRRQLDIYTKIGGRLSKWDELSAKLTSSEFIPELIVDALFGMHIVFEELRMDDQATAFEMITWANRGDMDIMSVDVPSGLVASSGKALSVY